MIRQTKTIQISILTINNLLADLLIRQMLERSQFAKLSRYTVYGECYIREYYETRLFL